MTRGSGLISVCKTRSCGDLLYESESRWKFTSEVISPKAETLRMITILEHVHMQTYTYGSPSFALLIMELMTSSGGNVWTMGVNAAYNNSGSTTPVCSAINP